MTDIQETKSTKKVSVIIDDDKNTQLHYCAAHGKEEEVLKELETEQKTDVANYLGWTPLMMACKNGHLTVVNLLLEHRANASKKNKFGMSVFLISITSGNLEIVHLILQHLLRGGISRQSMQYFFSPLSLSILFCHQHILNYLIDQHFNLNAVTPFTGITPLMFASAMENCEAFTLLLSKGVDITIKNYLGFTAHGITHFRNRKTDINVAEINQQLPPAAVITNSPHLQSQQPQVPIFLVSPQPTFLQWPTNQLLNQHIRKSSNVLSPSPNYVIATPNITPISPINYIAQPQVFFPPDFSPTHTHIYTTSPIPNVYNNSNDFLNIRMNQSNMFLSPLPQMNFASPCV